jgi:hypothetical protein
VVVDGVVYIGSDDGRVYALDTASGTVRWKKDTGGEVIGSATVEDGMVYIGSKSGLFVALDAATGEEKWRYVKDPKNPGRFPISTSPAVAFGVVFVGVGKWSGHLSGLDTTSGKEVWRLRRYKPNGGMLGPTIDGTTHAPADNLHKGGYILKKETSDLQALLIASGSEVPLALAAAAELEQDGISTRVVSMPSWELFELQNQEYRDEVLPRTCLNRVAIEAASPFGWERYVGAGGLVIGMAGFGASGPADQLMEHFGFTVENVKKKVKALIG